MVAPMCPLHLNPKVFLRSKQIKWVYTGNMGHM